MAKARSRKPVPALTSHDEVLNGRTPEAPGITAAELMSFLKETTGIRTWTERDLAKVLKLSVSQAKEAMAILRLQGYIQSVGNTGEWRVSDQGHLVSAAKPPRFTPQSVADAVAALRDRITAVNYDPDAAYRITEAVAFGDFLGSATRVQAAEVGIQLASKSAVETKRSAAEHTAALEFLKQLRGKTALLHVVPHENWMSKRSHIRLL